LIPTDLNHLYRNILEEMKKTKPMGTGRSCISDFVNKSDFGLF
jgi:hypothetical protein